MASFLRTVLRPLGRWILSLRYRVRLHGTEALRDLRGPVLVLPNHPAYSDPPILLTYLGRHLDLRPVVFADIMASAPLQFFVQLLHAIEIPNLARPSAEAREEARRALDMAAASLREGDPVLLYPSGRIMRTGHEQLGAASAAAEMLARVPEATVVLVRTRGLWGSRLGCAPTGKLPDLLPAFLRGAGVLLANLLFFTPRRPVDIDIEVVPPRRLPTDRHELNRKLEAWYNETLDPEPAFVPYHFAWGPRTFDFPDKAGTEAADISSLPEPTRREVFRMIEARAKHPLSDDDRSPGTLLESLGLDSLDRMELILEVEDRFGFSSSDEVLTVGDLLALAGGLAEGGTDQLPPPPGAWSKVPDPDRPLDVLDETIPQAFARRALERPGQMIVADDLSGALTYLRFATGARLMARRFAELPGPNIGLLLPSSVGADLAFFGLHLAGKLPVVLNWTTGPANLEHAIRLLDLQAIVSSRKFLDRLGLQLGSEKTRPRLVHLEDLRREISKFESLRMLAATRWFGGRFLKAAPRPDPTAPAVVLFTSGSEKAPKAVPLTHANLIANSRAGASALGLRRSDSVLGFLPAFHSFGLAGNMVMPILSGLRVVHHPDPTQAPALLRKIRAWRPTTILTTPTFLGHILRRAKPGDLDSFRLVITGAEACPAWVSETAAKLAPNAFVAEGYGVTECSPVVAANRPDRHRPKTLGPPLDNVELRIVDPETHEPIPTGETGMLLVRGPSVFPGYLGPDAPDPFTEVDGRRWYVTGDLASLDADGFLHFRGRLKRFLKAGGEMISLPAIESPLGEKFPATDEGPRVAVEGIELPHGGRQIALFTTEDISLDQANRLLSEHGLRGIYRLDDVIRVDRLPVLGTGKADYKVLRARLEKEAAAE